MFITLAPNRGYFLAVVITAIPTLNPPPLRFTLPSRSPSDESGDTFQPSLEQATGILTGGPRGPIPTAEVSLLSYQASDKHNLEEHYRLPDGRTVLSFSSFDTSRNREDDPNGYSIAFDSAGKELWKFSPEGGQEIESHLFLSSGTTYVHTRGQGAWPTDMVISLDAAGKEQWRFETESREQIDSIQADPQGNLFVKVDQDVLKLDSNGKKLWKKHLPIHSDEYFHVQTPDHGQLFASDDFSNTFKSPHFALVSANGKVKEVDLPDMGSFPLVAGDRLFYGGARGEARGIDLRTLKAWEVQTDSAVGGLYTPYAGPDGRIYFTGRRDDKLYCLSPDGKMLWQRNIEDEAPGNHMNEGFLPAADGSVYYAHEDGESIQQIKPDGTLGQRVRVSGGFESFQPGPDGMLYSVDRDAVVRRHNLKDGTTFELKLQLPESIRWEIDAVEPGGVVTLTDKLAGTLHKLRVDPSDEVKRQLEEARNAPPSQGSPGIKEGDGWVIIGNVRVKRRG